MFKLNDLLIDKNNDNILKKSCIEESYTTTSLNYIRNFKDDIIKSKKILYKNINEATNYKIINESFSDFFEKIKEIIDRFIKFIKSLVDRFITHIHKFILSDKYLIKNKDKFKLFDSSDEFDFDGYIFTFSKNIPVLNAIKEFDKNISLNNLIDIKKSNQEIINKIADERGKYISKLNNFYYDKFRGKVLGLDEYIESDDFQNELFKIFRNGEDSSLDITINSAYVNNCLTFIENYSKVIKSIKNNKKRIENEYKEIKNRISDTKYSNIDNDIGKLIGDKSHKVSDKVINQLDLLVKTKIDQIENMSIIHANAFSSKLDSYLDCFKQSKKILYNALLKIEKNHKGGK